MTRQCDRCRMTADVPEALARDTQTDTFHIGYLCPSCAGAKRLKDQRSVLLFSIGVGLLGVILVLVDPESQSNGGCFCINLFLFHLSLVLTIVPHELGHAIAAQTVGFRVYQIVIGFGTKLWSGTVAGLLSYPTPRENCTNQSPTRRHQQLHLRLSRREVGNGLPYSTKIEILID